MDTATLRTFEQSLARCTAQPGFLDRFYELFLASSPKVREKFAGTDFVRQKQMLNASFNLTLRAAQNDGGGQPAHLDGLAERHGARQLAIGAELYDLWLDSLLEAVRGFDPDASAEVEAAWEQVMGVGISYLCARYNQ